MILEANRKYKDITIILFLTAIGGCLRLYGLGEWSYTLDEPFTALLSNERMYSPQNPLYYALVVVSQALFGASEFSTRLPTMILGALGVPATFLLARQLFGSRAATFAALITVLSAWHIWHSQYARFYAGVYLFSVLAYHLHYCALKQDSLKLFFLGLIASAVAVLFHAMAIIVPAVAWLISLTELVKTNKEGRRHSVARLHIGVGVLIGLLLVVPLFNLAANWLSHGQDWGASPLKLVLKLSRDIGPVLMALGFVGILTGYSRDRLGGILLGFGLIIPVLIIVCASLLLPIRTDYVICMLPLTIVAAAGVIDTVANYLPQAKLACTLMLGLLLAAMLPDTLSHYTAKKSLNAKHAVAGLLEHYEDGDLVVSQHPGFSFYVSKHVDLAPWVTAQALASQSWQAILDEHSANCRTVFIALPIRRTPHPVPLENWLRENTQMIWRKSATRYDTRLQGIEIFAVNIRREQLACRPLTIPSGN